MKFKIEATNSLFQHFPEMFQHLPKQHVSNILQRLQTRLPVFTECLFFLNI